MPYIYPNPECKDASVKHTAHCNCCGRAIFSGRVCCGMVRSSGQRGTQSCRAYVQTEKEKWRETIIVQGLRHRGNIVRPFTSPPSSPQARTKCHITDTVFEVSKKRPPKRPICFDADEKAVAA